MEHINPETRCFACKKANMFENKLGGMTCPKCGQLVLPNITAKEHLKVMNMAFNACEQLERYDKLISLKKPRGKTNV